MDVFFTSSFRRLLGFQSFLFPFLPFLCCVVNTVGSLLLQSVFFSMPAKHKLSRTADVQSFWIPLSELTRCSENLPCHHRTCPACNEFPVTKEETEEEREKKLKEKIKANKVKKAIRDAKKEVAKGRQATITNFFHQK